MKNINDIFGEVIEEEIPDVKTTGISPFDYINSINFSKENLMVDDWSEKQYPPYIVNKGLSYLPDTIIFANEVNSRPHIDKKLQYQFLINTIRPKKRFSKWIKADKLESIDLVKQYYGYSTEKARRIMNILTQDQIETIKEKLKKGG